jgi:hypothetical protein
VAGTGSLFCMIFLTVSSLRCIKCYLSWIMNDLKQFPHVFVVIVFYVYILSL